MLKMGKYWLQSPIYLEIIQYIKNLILMLMRLQKIGKTYFSTPSTRTSALLEDWEYVAQIHQSLKKKNINEALNYLINSNLNGVILDKQTFFNTHSAMKQMKTCLSYQELTYKLYREYFTPCPLIVPWMKMLTGTTNEKLRKILTEDFKKLNIQMPTNISKQQADKEKKSKKDPKSSVQKQQKLISPVSIQPRNEQNKENLTNSETSQNKQPYKSMRRVQRQTQNLQKMLLNEQVPNFPNFPDVSGSQMAQMMELNKMLINLIKQKGLNITLNNIEIESKDDIQGDQSQNIGDEQLQEQIDGFEGTDEQKAMKMMQYLLATLKISIGKVEIQIEGDKINLRPNGFLDNGKDGTDGKDGKDGGNQSK